MSGIYEDRGHGPVGQQRSMTSLDLARWQFGITTLYHFIFVPVTIGLARRRIAAARLLLSPARFLIADEPAAHLHPEGAAALVAELAREARAGRGVLLIAHEPHGLGAFDELFTLRYGRLLPA